MMVPSDLLQCSGVLLLLFLHECISVTRNGIPCYGCLNATSNYECNRRGRIRCKEGCLTEIRSRNGKVTISKYCKQKWACLVLQKQPCEHNAEVCWNCCSKPQCNHDANHPNATDTRGQSRKTIYCEALLRRRSCKLVCYPPSCRITCAPEYILSKSIPPWCVKRQQGPHVLVITERVNNDSSVLHALNETVTYTISTIVETQTESSGETETVTKGKAIVDAFTDIFSINGHRNRYTVNATIHVQEDPSLKPPAAVAGPWAIVFIVFTFFLFLPLAAICTLNSICRRRSYNGYNLEHRRRYYGRNRVSPIYNPYNIPMEIDPRIQAISSRARISLSRR